MEAFLSHHQGQFKQVFKDANAYNESLSSLSDWWAMIALTGKVNSLSVATTIMEDMDDVRHKFNDLQSKLIAHLVNEYARKEFKHHATRCQMAIDILIRNLFERTADIGFLSQDDEVINFLRISKEDHADRRAIGNRLQSYIDKYTVYDDAILLNADGSIAFQLSRETRQGVVNDPCFFEALNKKDEFVECFSQTDIAGSPDKQLIYLHNVSDNGQTIGVVALVFRFENELRGIFEQLSQESMVPYVITDDEGLILTGGKRFRFRIPDRIPVDQPFSIMQFDKEDFLIISTKGQPYQDYPGPKGWHACAIIKLAHLSHRRLASKKLDQQIVSRLMNLFSKELLDIRDHSARINHELQLIVLNGIVTAAQSDSAEFIPILDAIKTIGKDIDAVFEQSINALFSAIIESQLDEVRLQAELAVDILDRNLYERANDSRWWALNPKIRNAMGEHKPNREVIESTLQDIHTLYTVYDDLYVYNSNRQYVAFSKEHTQTDYLKTVPESAGANGVFQLDDPQGYCVSPFAQFEIYNNRPTYIYNAAVRCLDQPHRILGGIGIVFDAEPEFRAILQDILHESPVGQPCFSLFTDFHGNLISASDDRKDWSQFNLPQIDMEQLTEDGSLSLLHKIGDQTFLLGVAQSKGYREFKNDDGYDETIISWVFVPC